MPKRILILGATGMLGRPVTRCLLDRGHGVRILSRSPKKARQMFQDSAEIVPGSATRRDHIRAALAGCDAVHINLPTQVELAAVGHILRQSAGDGLERLTFVSEATVREENRWFDMVDVKMRTEALIARSGIAHTVFCPTWVMGTLHNFVQAGRAVVIASKKPPELHFLAAADFGRMVASTYDDDRCLGKRLFVHGPEAFTLPGALERYFKTCHPRLGVTRVKLSQAKMVARLTGSQSLADACRLIEYFDQVGELGDPKEANALLGAPTTTLAQWFKTPGGGLPERSR